MTRCFLLGFLLIFNPLFAGKADSPIPKPAGPKKSPGGHYVKASRETDQCVIDFYAFTCGDTIEGKWQGTLRQRFKSNGLNLEGDIRFTMPDKTGDFEGEGVLSSRVQDKSGSLSFVMRILLRRDSKGTLVFRGVPKGDDLLAMKIASPAPDCDKTVAVSAVKTIRQLKEEKYLRDLPDDSKAVFHKALKNLREGKGKDASSGLGQLIQSHPRFVPAWYNLATMEANAGEMKRAEELCLKVLELDPEYPDVYNTLGMIRYRSGKQPEGISLVEKAIHLDPEYIQAWYNLFGMYQEGGMSEKSEDAGRTLIGIIPQEEYERDLIVKALNELSNLKIQSGDLGEARSLLNKALRIDPESAQTYRNLGAVAFFQENMDEAIQYGEESRRLDPGYARTWYNLGHAYRRKGDMKKTIECYHRYVELEKDPEEKGRVEKARQIIKDLSK